MSEQSAVYNVDVTQKEAVYFPAVIISKNEEMVQWFDEMESKTASVLEEAQLHTIIDEPTK
jgi:hypothetical protein